MDIYEPGASYSVEGENLKLRVTEKYIPRAAGFTDSFGSLVNTQDLITEFQMQAKF